MLLLLVGEVVDEAIVATVFIQFVIFFFRYFRGLPATDPSSEHAALQIKFRFVVSTALLILRLLTSVESGVDFRT